MAELFEGPSNPEEDKAIIAGLKSSKKKTVAVKRTGTGTVGANRVQVVKPATLETINETLKRATPDVGTKDYGRNPFASDYAEKKFLQSYRGKGLDLVHEHFNKGIFAQVTNDHNEEQSLYARALAQANPDRGASPSTQRRQKKVAAAGLDLGPVSAEEPTHPYADIEEKDYYSPNVPKITRNYSEELSKHADTLQSLVDHAAGGSEAPIPQGFSTNRSATDKMGIQDHIDAARHHIGMGVLQHSLGNINSYSSAVQQGTGRGKSVDSGIENAGLGSVEHYAEAARRLKSAAKMLEGVSSTAKEHGFGTKMPVILASLVNNYKKEVGGVGGAISLDDERDSSLFPSNRFDREGEAIQGQANIENSLSRGPRPVFRQPKSTGLEGGPGVVPGPRVPSDRPTSWLDINQSAAKTEENPRLGPAQPDPNAPKPGDVRYKTITNPAHPNYGKQAKLVYTPRGRGPGSDWASDDISPNLPKPFAKNVVSERPAANVEESMANMSGVGQAIVKASVKNIAIRSAMNENARKAGRPAGDSATGPIQGPLTAEGKVGSGRKFEFNNGQQAANERPADFTDVRGREGRASAPLDRATVADRTGGVSPRTGLRPSDYAPLRLGTTKKEMVDDTEIQTTNINKKTTTATGKPKNVAVGRIYK